MHPQPARLQAFSLIELAIAITIMGLLAGGAIIGQSLIREGQVRAVVAEANRFITAVSAFDDKYGGLPGDLPNAIDIWGAAHATPATCTTTNSLNSRLTCNGNGSGAISGAMPHLTDSATAYEMYRAWQHLANAGLIEGNFTGIRKEGGIISESHIGVNVPASKLPQAGWTLRTVGRFPGNSTWFGADFGTVLQVGGQNTSFGSYITEEPSLTGEEAYSIDIKMDDGRPGTGKVIAFMNNFQPNCVPPSNDRYLFGNTTMACTLNFITSR